MKCIEDEISFELPEGWSWCRLLSLSIKIGAGSTPTGGAAVYTTSGIKFIRSQNVYDDGLVLDDVAYIPEEINQKKSGSIVKSKDILLNITGGSIGRCALVSDDFDIANVNQHVMIIRLANLELRKYIHSVVIWCSLLNIAKMELGKTLDSAKNTGINYPYLRSVNVRWNDVDLSDLKEMRFEPEELERYTVRLNDLLICEGGDVGRSCVWTDDKEILYQNALHRVRFYGECNPFYFMYYMMYYESLGIIKALCKGVTIKHLTGNVLSLIPFA